MSFHQSIFAFIKAFLFPSSSGFHRSNLSFRAGHRMNQGKRFIQNHLVVLCALSLFLGACGTEYDESPTGVHFAENAVYEQTNQALEEWDWAEEQAMAAEEADETTDDTTDEGTDQDYFDVESDTDDDAMDTEAKDPAEESGQAGAATLTLEDCGPGAGECKVVIALTLGDKTLTLIFEAIYRAIAEKLANGGVLEDLLHDNSLADLQYLTEEIQNILDRIQELGLNLPECELILNIHINEAQLRRHINQLIGRLVADFPLRHGRFGRCRSHPWIGGKIACERGIIYRRVVGPMVSQILDNLEQQVINFVAGNSSITVNILLTATAREDLHVVIRHNDRQVISVSGNDVDDWIDIFRGLSSTLEPGTCYE